MNDNEDDLNISYDVGQIISSIIQDRKLQLNAERSEMGKARIDFNSRGLSEEHPELPPDVARRCKHCGLQFEEHYQLANHLSRRHLKESLPEYRDEIEDKYNHPEGWERVEIDQYGKYYCPFCEEFFNCSPQRHALQHSELMKFIREATKI